MAPTMTAPDGPRADDAGLMSESTRPIRALIRGLEALAVLNRRDGSTVSEIAKTIRLPRTTTYRILETLRSAGYATRDPADERYRPTLAVRALAAGWDEQSRLADRASGVLEGAARELGWPVALASLSGSEVVIVDAGLQRAAGPPAPLSAGQVLPLASDAAGIVLAAQLDDEQRSDLVSRLASGPGDPGAGDADTAELRRLVDEARGAGYALRRRSDPAGEELGLAVPLGTGGSPSALLVRWPAAALPAASAVERFLPRLRAAAEEMTRGTAVD